MAIFGLSTRRKVALARIARAAVSGLRRMRGLTMQGEFTRNGLRWSLDLDEGIDFAIYLFGAFEPELVRCYTKLITPGSVVLDLGANIGAHTLPLARQTGPGGKVIAVEATSFAFAKLQRNSALNPGVRPQIVLHHALLASNGSSLRPEALHSSWPLTGNATTHPTLAGTLKPLGQARTVTLDSLLQEESIDKVDWIKIDVDGNELPVLKGGVNMLNKDRPSILMELAPYCHADTPGQFAELLTLLWDTGYQIRDLKSQKILPPDVHAVESFIPSQGSINVLATCQPGKR